MTKFSHIYKRSSLIGRSTGFTLFVVFMPGFGGDGERGAGTIYMQRDFLLCRPLQFELNLDFCPKQETNCQLETVNFKTFN